MNPAHLSPSQVMSYQTCPKRYHLERVEKVPQQPQGALLGGSAVHECIEKALGGEKVPFADVFDFLLSEVGGESAVRWGGRRSRAYPNGEDRTWWLDNAPAMIDRALALVRFDYEQGYEILDVEAAYNVEIGGRPWSLRSDLVQWNPSTNSGLVSDWKTGQESPFGIYQLSYYLLAIQSVRGIAPESMTGRIVLLRKDGADMVRGYEPATAIPVALQFADEFAEGINRDYWPLRVTQMCVACSVRAHCPHGSTLGGGEDE